MSATRMDAFRAMLAKDPAHGLAQFGLANELVKAEEFAEARDVLVAYLAANDDQGSAFRLLAQACEKLGLAGEARDAYRRGIDAANRHGHPSMVQEFEDRLEDLDG
ncbi:MAG: tetratricopeptide repeat protein [Acidobacteria bacterium]|nr:tetratricopeptide repeat protein [Acidobacteriota bacterium]